jgi:hypothetical protein
VHARHYILDENRQPVAVDDLINFGRWFQTADRRVARDVFCGPVDVSTVFLGIDHGFMSPRPVLFETMIFGGRFDQEQHRFCTWEEAEAGHHSICDRVRYVEGARGYSRSHWRKIREQIPLRHATLSDALLARFGALGS